MWHDFLNSILVQISSSRFWSGAFIIFFFAIVIFGIQRADTLEWSDLITAKNSNRVSLTKLLQFIGGIVGTWVIVRMTMFEKLTWDIFATYLAYVASSDGFSKFIAAKYGVKIDDKEEKEVAPLKNF
ncbi:MAG: hypothetical protein QXN55_00955 [Candidatus Nitrosotenuis sp.]